MSELTSERCEACQVGAPSVEHDEASELLQQLPEWSIVERGGVSKLVRRYHFPNFVEALSFTNRVGELAEQQDHHPDLLTRWGEVEVTWWTHKIDGLHRNDFVCAAHSDELYANAQ